MRLTDRLYSVSVRAIRRWGSLLIVVGLLGLLLILIRPAAAQAVCTVQGIVFRDYNANGALDILPNEPGEGGITITAYLVDGTTVEVVSAPDGAYALDVPQGERVRLEFTGLPSYLFSGPFGANSSTTVTFVDCAGANAVVDFAVNNPGHYCQNNPTLTTSCFVSGSQIGQTLPALVSFPYNGGGNAFPDYDLPPHTNDAQANQVGPIWGLAYQRGSNSLFAGAFMKRHVGFGPGGTGAIYRVDRNTLTVSLFLNLNVLLGPNTAGADPHPNGTDFLIDPNGWDPVGKISLGDMDISEDGLTLWTINLADRQLYAIPIGEPPAPPPPAQIRRYPVPFPGDCPDPDENVRPFATKVHDGLVYVGMVCSAQSTQDVNDLRAYVYSFDPTAAVFAPVLDFPLDYPRGCTDRGIGAPGGCIDAEWRPWIGTFSLIPIPNGSYPQPWLTDLEFDNGDIILGLRDRLGDQTGFRARSTDPADPTLHNGIGAGDTLRACLNPGGGYTLEFNAACGGRGPTAGANSGQGPGNGEFYYSETHQVHDEISIGGLLQLPGYPDLASTAFDPIPGPANLFDGGVIWMNNQTGGRTRSYRIFDTNDDPLTFGKANGLGDLEALCAPAPLEIGNRVWYDPDRNGIQDPDEPPIPGVTVNLYAANGMLLATTITDANGEYYFTNANVLAGIQPRTNYIIRLDNPLDYQPGGPLNQLIITTAFASAALRDSNGQNVGGFPQATALTGGYGDNDHTYDFGFSPIVVRTPTPPATQPGGGFQPAKLVFSKQVNPPVAQPGEIVVWTLTASNTGDTPAVGVVIEDVIPAELIILSVSATKGTVSIDGQRVRVEVGTLAPGETVTVTITTQGGPNASGAALTNSATLTWDGGSLSASADLLQVEELPRTGEAPRHIWLVIISGGLAAVGAALLLARRMRF